MKAREGAAETLIDRLRSVEDGAVLQEVERVLDEHARDAYEEAGLLTLRDDDLNAVLRQLLGEGGEQPV